MEKEFEIKLPKLGESIVSATVVHIYKKEGDIISKDETLLEVATDKVNSEIPSPVEGTIKEIKIAIDETIEVGQTIGIVSQSENETQEGIKESPEISNEVSAIQDSVDKKSFFSPAVLKLAQENNISLDELNSINGTGEGGRVSKKDIKNFIDCKAQKSNQSHESDVDEVHFDSSGKLDEVNYLSLSPVRKATALTMQNSLKIPTAYLVEEIDITDLEDFIFKNKKAFFEKNNLKLTITSYLAKAISKACKKYPLANSTFEEDKIKLYKNINLAIAVSLQDEVLVPSVKNIENLDFIDLVKEINLLVKKTKDQKLNLHDTKNSTITLTNFGMTNISIGLPIINYPQASIIGAGAIEKKPLVINNKIEIRSIINISLGFDHRIFDGIYACNFLNEIKKYLNNEFDRTI